MRVWTRRGWLQTMLALIMAPRPIAATGQFGVLGRSVAVRAQSLDSTAAIGAVDAVDSGTGTIGAT